MGGASPLQTRGIGRVRISGLARVVGAVLLIATATAYWTGVGSTAPADQFEITDGNIVDNDQSPAPNIPDWDTIFGTVSNTSGFLTTAFTPDLIASDPLPSPPCSANKTGDLTVYTSGGSDKNGDTIPTWTYQSGSVPQAKDDLTNVYAAAKMDGTDTIFYFGLERSEVNGSAHVDFEFLKSPIGLQQGTDKDGNPTVDSSGCPSGNFSGSRQLNDILVSMDLENGGGVADAEYFKWNGTTYVEFTPTAGEVGFTTNSATAPIACGDWVCRDKFGNTITELPQHAFMEGFINVTQALDTAPGCYSSFISKTRSSHEWNSELKDFALNEFNTCNAFITIAPDGINAVGTNHTFTGHVETNVSGSYTNAPAGTLIDFDIQSGPGSFVGGDTCLTVGTTGSCTVTITSAAAGTTIVSASTQVQVGPVVVTRSTNTSAGPGGSGNATKNWVDAYVKVTPDDVNPVNEQHTFTVEYGVLPSAATTGVTVPTPTISPTVLPTGFTLVGNTCAAPTKVTDVNTWTCTVTINSSVATVYTATATGTTTVTMSGGTPSQVVLARSTSTGLHGPGGNEGATKTYVDARIFVGPDGLNEVDANHTVEGHVQTKNGDGAWTDAPAGTTITFAKESGVGGFVDSDNTCDTIGTTGKCTVAIVSAEAGTTEVSASATVTVNGVSITRTTDTAVNTAAGGSGNMTKKWADGSIEIVDDGVNEVNDEHVFTVTVTAHPPTDDETVTFDSITPFVSSSPAPDSAVSTCATPTVALDGLSATCTYTINNDEADIFDVDATADISFDDGVNDKLTITRATDGDFGPIGSDGARKTYVDARVSVGPDGVNAVGDEHEVIGFAEFNDGTGWQPAEGETIDFASSGDVGGFVDDIDSCTAGAEGMCSVHIVSSEAGVQWVSASTSYAVLGVTLSRTTAVDGPTDPDNLRKEWVSATIDITPDGVNEVGDPHTFDITVTGTSSGAEITFGAVTTSVTPDPDEKADTCSPADRTVDGGVLTCTLTINNDTAGVFTANVDAVVTIGGVVFNLTTDGESGSGPAQKVYVDARISLTPDGVNEVGDPHVMTAVVEVNDGEGWASADGATVALTKLSGPGELSADTCETDSSGECEATLTSDVAGVTEVGATTTVDVLGVPLTRSTNSNAGPDGSDNLEKRWVDAVVAISPDGVNPVGADHTFEITVTAIPSGSGDPTFSIDPGVTPAPDELSTTCDSPTVDGNVASCTLTIRNNTADVFTAHVTAQVTVGGVTVTRSTDSTVAPSGPGGTGPAEKVYVDANIQVTPDGVNAVGDPHTVTGHVNVDDGTGEVDAPDGTEISFEIESGPGSLSADSCDTTGGTGSCSVTLNSAVAGVTVVSATSTVTIDAVTLDLATNGSGANSDNLTKRWIDASVTIGPSAVNPIGEPHTFDVVVTAIPSGASPVSFDLVTTSVTPEPTSLVSTCEAPVVNGNTATCTLTINSSVVNLYTANATARVSVDGASVTRSTDVTVASAGPGGSGPATKEYVAVAGVVLVRTGYDPVMLVALGAGLLAIGLNLVLASRWRSSRRTVIHR
jgi:hypothetical protein